MAEMRIDGGVAYTWEDFSEFYRGKYKKNEIAAYWEECPMKKGKGKKSKDDKPEPKAKAKVKAKAQAKSETKVRKPRVDEDLLKAALEEAILKPAKTVELIEPFDEGVPGPEHFKITEAEVGDVPEGGFLLQVLYMSADPYQRSRIKVGSGGTAGPMKGFVCGRVLASKNAKWFPGDFVGASLPYTTVQVVTEEQLKSTIVWKLTGYIDESTAAQGIGVLGMPGSTAYGGFLDICKPKRAKKAGESTGEVLFVSAASGAVGQLVGQLAKIIGCKVIGSAGGPAKCAALKEKFGFDHAIDYKTCADSKALQEKLKECSPEGIDMYFENVGGMHFDAAFASLKPGGRVAVCGCISQYNTGGASHGGLGSVASEISLGALIYPQIRIEGFMCMRWLSGQKGNFLRDMSRYLRQGKLQITETVTEGVENWGAAFQSLFTGANNGKVAVKVCDVAPLRKLKAQNDEEAV